MYSILDIDLDYFSMLTHPGRRLEELLDWADCAVSVLVQRHNHAFARWRRILQVHSISPTHILHVDEHHDMMDNREQTNIANFMYHAMRIWPQCRAHWLVQYPIDYPSLWLDEETWHSLRCRFSHGTERPHNWPRPDLVSVCTSPEFVNPDTTSELLKVVKQFHKGRATGKRPNKALQPIAQTTGSG